MDDEYACGNMKMQMSVVVVVMLILHWTVIVLVEGILHIVHPTPAEAVIE